MTIGPDGRPKVREFGNVKRPSGFGFRGLRPEIAGKMEPMTDVVSTEFDSHFLLLMGTSD